jgi:hypothetical protein
MGFNASKIGHVAGNTCLVVVSVIVALLLIESGLRLTSNPRYEYWHRATYESYYFHYATSPPAKEPDNNFHPVRGWTHFSIKRGPDGYVIEDTSGAPWRGTQYVPYAKIKRRVILVGDSWMYGWYVRKDETIDHFLNSRFGSDLEVINLSVRGYGLDQIVLVANEVIPQLSPDDIVVGFIADDLNRSCQSFSPISSVAKSRFELVDGRLVPPRPVPTPYEIYLQHRERQTLDAVLAKLYSVRVVALAMGPFLRGAQETCIAKLNAELLRSLMKDTPQKTRIHLIHLDMALPPEFKTEMAALNIPYYSAPADIAATSQALGVPADRERDSDFGHPKGGLNAIYAYMIYKMLSSMPSVVPSTRAVSQPLRSN